MYDPSAGTVAGPAVDKGQADRFSLDGNPQREQDWPRYRLGYELDEHGRQDVDTAFTVVDFVAADPRFASCFASVTAGEEPVDAENRLVAVDEYLRLGARGRSRALPCVLLIDEQNRLRRAAGDEKLVEAAQRCLDAWHSLQESGGIGNSHARAALQDAQRAWEAEKARLLAHQADARPTAPAPGPASQAPAAPAATVPAAAAPTEAIEPAPSSDDPWIETARCTTCNECTQLNDRMFGYNENKQAYIRDADAAPTANWCRRPRPARWPSSTPASRATPTSRGWRNCSSAPSRFSDAGD